MTSPRIEAFIRLGQLWKEAHSNPLDFYDASQPRDRAGRFASTGSSGSSETAAKKTKKSGSSIDRSDHKALIAVGREFIEKHKLNNDLKPTKKEESLLKDEQKVREELSKNPSSENYSKLNTIRVGYFSARDDREAKIELKMQSVIKDLQASGLSKSEAEDLTKTTAMKLTSRGWTPESSQSISSDLTEFHQITGGKAKIDRLVAKRNRAYADWLTGEINIGKNLGANVNRETLFHEAGHYLEYSDLRLTRASRGWLESRSTSKTPRSLNDIVGRKSYDSDEVALEDKWISPYVGKVYGGKGAPTEVISMGLEYFSSTKGMARLAMTDREHFEFILGVLISGRES